jgi:hypothetical protein
VKRVSKGDNDDTQTGDRGCGRTAGCWHLRRATNDHEHVNDAYNHQHRCGGCHACGAGGAGGFSFDDHPLVVDIINDLVGAVDGDAVDASPHLIGRVGNAFKLGQPRSFDLDAGGVRSEQHSRRWRSEELSYPSCGERNLPLLERDHP